MRKSITILATLLFALVFAACANAPSTTESESAGSQETVAEATEAPAEEASAEEDSAEEAPAEEASAPTSYTVDTEASVVGWYGSKPVGLFESGTIAISEGQLNFVGDQFVDGSIIIDMTTIETDSQTGDMANNLVEHLSSDDFFSVETYPTSTLVIKSAEATDTENQYLVKADLTVKETTKEIEFISDVTVGDGTITASADIVIDRSEFDVQYGSGSFFDNLGDKLISDEVEMTVTLVANS